MRYFIVVICGMCLMVGFVASSQIEVPGGVSLSAEKVTPSKKLVPFVLKEFYKGVSWVGG
ncbi:uncharacterized protein METZ01_LOCUS270899, partial [marine metagenome]